MMSKYCKKIDIHALDEEVMFYLYENDGDKDHVACIGFDVAEAEALVEILTREITRAKSSPYYKG
jgi:hypothetical protein